MQPVTIRHEGGLTSNAHLEKKIELRATITRYCWFRPDGDGYEQVFEETTTRELIQKKMRLRGERKQRAADAIRPVIIVRKEVPALVPVSFNAAMKILDRRDLICENDSLARQLEVVVVRVKTERELKIERLDEQMKALVKLLEKNNTLAK